MDYNTLLDLVSDLGYHLSMCGAETFRVEESINRITSAYGIASEAYAMTNYLTVSIITDDGTPMTRMRRIGYHGNDLDSVERFSNLSRKICSELPDLKVALDWLKEVKASRITYTIPMILLGNFLGASGFAIFFGSHLFDSILAGLCGIIVGLIGLFMDRFKANLFFRTIIASFFMSAAAYGLASNGIAENSDTIIIGTLMILVPGLLFTNAMRDIIYGDTNSGINRIVQVFLIAVAIALGTAAGWNVIEFIWETPLTSPAVAISLPIQLLGCLIGCIGFSILFNIHGPGMLLCAAGGILSWSTYIATIYLGGSDLDGYFWAALAASFYSEVLARIRKYPAISYLVVSIFPLIPGASVYYTMTHAVQGNMEAFADKGLHTIAIAGCIAVGVLMVSTSFRLWFNRNHSKVKISD